MLHWTRQNRLSGRQSEEEPAMEPMEYTVRSINGDYADLISDTGVENQVAMFLLPEGTDVGSRLLFEDFQWTLL